MPSQVPQSTVQQTLTVFGTIYTRGTPNFDGLSLPSNPTIKSVLGLTHSSTFPNSPAQMSHRTPKTMGLGAYTFKNNALWCGPELVSQAVWADKVRGSDVGRVTWLEPNGTVGYAHSPGDEERVSSLAGTVYALRLDSCQCEVSDSGVLSVRDLKSKSVVSSLPEWGRVVKLSIVRGLVGEGYSVLGLFALDSGDCNLRLMRTGSNQELVMHDVVDVTGFREVMYPAVE